MNLTLLLIYVLATWRVSSLLSREEGPYGTLRWIRQRAGVIWDDQPDRYSNTQLGKLLLCLWCNSVWVGAGFSTIYSLLNQSWSLWIPLTFAFSAGTIITDEVLSGLEQPSTNEPETGQSYIIPVNEVAQWREQVHPHS